MIEEEFSKRGSANAIAEKICMYVLKELSIAIKGLRESHKIDFYEYNPEKSTIAHRPH